MLILTRRTEESIMLGDDIEIVILAIKGNHVRLGIQAPSAIKVLREELRGKEKQAEFTGYNNKVGQKPKTVQRPRLLQKDLVAVY